MFQKFYSGLSSRNRILFNIALLVLMGVVLNFACITPILKKSSVIDREIAEEEALIQRDLGIISFKGKIQMDAKVYNKYLIQEVPDEDVINAEFLSAVERLATRSNVNLVKSNPSSVNKIEGANEYFANLDCEGTVEDVIGFMYRINSTDDLLKIVRFTMTPKRGTPNQVVASMSVMKLVVGADAT